MRTKKKTSKRHLNNRSKRNTNKRPKRSSNNIVIRRNIRGETQLHVACIAGNIDKVTKLLESNHPTEVRDYCGWTPLHEAANYGHVEIAELLIKSGANVNDPGGPKCEGITPLHDAASCGHFSMMLLLYNNGADFRAKTQNGETILDCLEDWKSRSDDLSPDEQFEYDNMLSKLSAALRQSAVTSPVSEGPNTLEALTLESETLNEDEASENVSTGEDYGQTIANVENHLQPNSSQTGTFSLIPDKIQSALVDSEEMIDDWLEKDPNCTVEEKTLVHERSSSNNNKKKSIIETSGNDLIIQSSRTVVAENLENNDLPQMTRESKHEIVEMCNRVALKRELCSLDVELVGDVANGENYSEYTNIGDNICEDWLEKDPNCTVEEKTLVHERSSSNNNKKKSIFETSGNDLIIQSSRTVVAENLENNDLPQMTRESNHGIAEMCNSVALKRELCSLDVELVGDVANGENYSECTNIGDNICAETSLDVEMETRKKDESSKCQLKRKTTIQSANDYVIKKKAKGEMNLHVACINGNVKEVTKLLKSINPTEVRDNYGWTPLHEAANHGHVKVAEILIKYGADVDDPGGPMCGGVTPLHVAASRGYLSMIFLLIESGANLRSKTRDGDTVLGRLEAWKNFAEDLSPSEQVQYDELLSKISAVLQQTARQSSLSGQQNILENSTNKNETRAEGREPEIICGDENYRRTVENMRKRLRPRGMVAKDETSKRNETENTSNNYVIKRNPKGETKLHVACIAGNIDKVTKLLESGHPTEVRDNCGWTPLHEAANHGHLEIAELLIKSGANVDDPGGPECEGITPLHDAASYGHLSMMFLLIKRGANLQAKTKDGETILDYLEAWRNRSKGLSPSQRVDYYNLHSRLAAFSPQ